MTPTTTNRMEEPKTAAVRPADATEPVNPSQKSSGGETPVSVAHRGKERAGLVDSVLSAWAEWEFGVPCRAMPREQTMTGGGDPDEGVVPLVQHALVQEAIGCPSGAFRRLCCHVWYHGLPPEDFHLAPGHSLSWLGLSWPKVRSILLRDVRRSVGKALTDEALERLRKQDQGVRL